MKHDTIKLTLPVVHQDEYLLFKIGNDFDVVLIVDSVLMWLGIGFIVLYIGIRMFRDRIGFGRSRSFEIDQAQFGLGDQKIILRPNDTDRQIAYRIWVELSTRKIGVSIDLEDDVISEVYDSWYSFFAVTRELIKDVPVSKFKRQDTKKIIRLSIDVLNNGLRPHLTKWQARFRRWYERALEQEELKNLAPQEVQKKFPDFASLEGDLLQVNQHLIQYRKKMYQLVSGAKETPSR